jgi:hypothetical protein
MKTEQRKPKRDILKRFLCITLFLCIIFPVSAIALDFNETYFFAGSSEGGTGSATMNIDIIDNRLTVLLDNTSPTTLNSSSDPNTPGITGFGFNLKNDPEIIGWTLFADSNTTPGSTSNIEIGDQSDSGTEDWTIATSIANISVDYLLRVAGGGQNPSIDGALFNPDAKGSSGLPGDGNTKYFTEAILTMEFDDDPIFDEDFANFSPFVRMQRVGLDGEGSLKLTVIPEPSTMIISGLFLLGAGVFMRRRLHRKS